MQLVEPRPARPLPIRLTPLIDVVFILLVFFMLTTRLLPVEHLLLNNATTESATGESIPEMTLDGDGLLGWRGQRLPIPAMVGRLTANGIKKSEPDGIGRSLAGEFHVQPEHLEKRRHRRSVEAHIRAFNKQSGSVSREIIKQHTATDVDRPDCRSWKNIAVPGGEQPAAAD